MRLVKIKPDTHYSWLRREIRFKETPLKKSAAIQISRLTLKRKEPYHINRKGYVMCFVIEGWMEAFCEGKNLKLREGEGIVFEPGERHRINKGRGWMISASSIDYKSLKTEWEKF